MLVKALLPELKPALLLPADIDVARCWGLNRDRPL
jgi:hypothetical protein